MTGLSRDGGPWSSWVLVQEKLRPQAGRQASWNTPPSHPHLPPLTAPPQGWISDSASAPAVSPLHVLRGDRAGSRRGRPRAEVGPGAKGAPPAPTCPPKGQAWLLEERARGLAAFSQPL